MSTARPSAPSAAPAMRVLFIGDVLGRFSGNKFGLILRNCTVDDTNTAAERFLAGIRDVQRCQAVQPEVVQPRQLPDGLLEVYARGQRKPDAVLIEVATYPEKRVQEQAQEWEQEPR